MKTFFTREVSGWVTPYESPGKKENEAAHPKTKFKTNRRVSHSFWSDSPLNIQHDE
jgi:hypothetical protein